MSQSTKKMSFDEYQKMVNYIALSIDRKNLEDGAKKSLYFDSITEQQKHYHQIDACAVLSDGKLNINPQTWSNTSYYISDKFESDGIQFKIFISKC